MAPLTTQNSGPTGSSTHPEPGLKLLPCPVVHPDLAAAAALAAAHEQRSAPPIQVGFPERERLVNPQAGAPEHYDQPAQPAPVGPSPAWRIIATISSTVGGSAG